MWNLHTANEEHWVPISTVASFKRMREFAPIGVEGISKALRELSQDLEVDESGAQVRRKHEIQEPKGQFERSVYAVRLILCYAMAFPRLYPDLEIERFRHGRT